MKYQYLYLEILEKLKTQERPALKLNSEVFQDLSIILNELLEKPLASVREEVHQIMCILQFTQNLSPLFSDAFQKILENKETPADLLVFTLGAFQKHVVHLGQRDGMRVAYPLVQSLRGLLHHTNPEVMEWTVRTIEEMGSQGLSLRNEIKKIKPGLSALFNIHRKRAKEIIEGLEKRWPPGEKEKKE